MRILICAAQAPLPPSNGLRLQITALLHELRRSHEVRVLAFRMPDQRAELHDEPDLRLVPWPAKQPVRDLGALVRAIVRRRPFRWDDFAARLRAPLRDELNRFRPDVVHVTSGVIAALGRELAGRPSVLAALDAGHLNYDARVLAATGLRRRLLRGEARRLRRFEATEYMHFGRVVLVSDADLRALHSLNPALRGAVVPNGVDAAHYAPLASIQPDRDRIVFTGVMSYAPNVLAAQHLATQILPRVRARRPASHLALVGRSASPAVAALGRVEGVQVTGEVADLRPWLAGSRVYACPMTSGTGIKNKLLEAMACGLPSVATPLATQGLDVRDGRELLIAETDEAFGDALLRVLEDDELAARLGAAGRAYVIERHDWRAVGLAYERVYEEVLRDARTGGAASRAT